MCCSGVYRRSDMMRACTAVSCARQKQCFPSSPPSSSLAETCPGAWVSLLRGIHVGTFVARAVVWSSSCAVIPSTSANGLQFLKGRCWSTIKAALFIPAPEGHMARETESLRSNMFPGRSDGGYGGSVLLHGLCRRLYGVLLSSGWFEGEASGNVVLDSGLEKASGAVESRCAFINVRVAEHLTSKRGFQSGLPGRPGVPVQVVQSRPPVHKTLRCTRYTFQALSSFSSQSLDAIAQALSLFLRQPQTMTSFPALQEAIVSFFEYQALSLHATLKTPPPNNSSCVPPAFNSQLLTIIPHTILLGHYRPHQSCFPSSSSNAPLESCAAEYIHLFDAELACIPNPKLLTTQVLHAHPVRLGLQALSPPCTFPTCLFAWIGPRYQATHHTRTSSPTFHRPFIAAARIYF